MEPSRLSNVSPPPLISLNEAAERLNRKYGDVIYLSQGISRVEPTEDVLNAVRMSLKEKKVNFYSPDQGIPELREAISRKLKQINGISYNAEDEILVTAGANVGAFFTFMSLLGSNDEAILPSPYYFNHEMGIKIAGGLPVEVPLLESKKGYFLGISEIERALGRKTKIIVLVSPNNPTSSLFSHEDLKNLASLLENHSNVFIFSDETYMQFVFGNNRHISPASFPEFRKRTIITGSFSKTYGLAGWRVGWLAAPKECINEILKIQDTSAICTPVISQICALSALESPSMEKAIQETLTEYEISRKLISSWLENNPWLDHREIKGAYYAFPKVNLDDIKSENLAWEILKKERVVLVPGSAFGTTGEGHLRISFGSVDPETLKVGLERIDRFFQNSGY